MCVEKDDTLVGVSVTVSCHRRCVWRRMTRWVGVSVIVSSVLTYDVCGEG